MIPFLQRLSEIAENTPERAAVVDRDGGRTTSYAELNELSSRVASYLKSLGLQKEDLVAIKLEKSMEYVAVQLGVMKCGCAFVPVSDDMGEERISHVLSDSGARLVFDGSNWNKAKEFEPLLPSEWAVSDEHDLAFIIYTSGSTGKPKGVVEEYGAYRFMAKGTAEEVLEPYTMQDDAIRFANVAPVTFSAFTIINVCIVCEACTNYMVSGAVVRNPLLYMQFLKDHRIDAMFLTASLVKPLSDNKDLSPKVIMLSSERVSDVYSERFAVLNLYCNTELMSTACNFVLDKAYSNTPIGARCSYTDMILLDNGTVSEKEGEICLYLPYFRGYLNQPEENEKAFVDVGGKKFFRTKDFARRGEDGLLYVLGRADDMVKINGNRVEPAEVEAALKKVLETKVVAVKAFENEGKHYLCAYYQKENAVAEEKIRAALKPLLPEYMIPSYYVRFEKMPLNTNGKVDKASLKAPDIRAHRPEYAPPETETQKILCAAAEKILGEYDDVGKIGLDDDFGFLGGDSISAMELMVACKTLPLTVPLILEKRTVRAISEAAEAIMSRAESDTQENASLTKTPLNDMQVFMIRYENQFPKTVMYNISLSITLECNVDVELFAASVRKVIAAHPALLSVIEKEGENYYLRYEPSFDRKIPVDFMSEEELVETQKNFVHPFYLDGSPLFRARVIKTEKRSVFLFDVSHIITDGISMRIILDDIERILRGDRLETDCFPRTLQKEADFKKSETYSKDEAYFKRRYDKEGYHTRPQTDFNSDKNILDTITGNFNFPKEKVAAVCKRCAIGKNEFYAVAVALSVAMYNNARNVMLTWIWNGRKEASEQRSVGVFLKEFPIAFSIDDKTRLSDLLVQAKNQVLESIAHGSLSYFDMKGRHSGQYLTCLVYQGDMYFHDKHLSFIKTIESLETEEFPDACDNNAPELEILDSSTDYGFILDYNAAQYKRESMEKFMCLFSTSCKSLLKTIENPDITFGEIKNNG